MIDWADRFDSLYHYLQSELGISDRQAVAILITQYLPCVESTRSDGSVGPTTPAPWIVAETDYFSNPVFPAWFTFGTNYETVEITRIKNARPYKVHGVVEGLLTNRDTPRIWVNSGYATLSNPIIRHPWHQLAPKLVSVRIAAPRRAAPLPSHIARIRQMYKDCIAPEHRPPELRIRPIQRLPEPITAVMAALQALNHDQTDWNSLYWNISGVIDGHAKLFGREKPTRDDYLAGIRVIHDSVPWWTAKIMHAVGEKDGWAKEQTVMQQVGLDRNRYKPLITRLVANNVLQKSSFYLRTINVESTQLLSRAVEDVF